MKYTIKHIVFMASIAMVNASCIDLDTAPYDRETDLTFWKDNKNAAIATLNTCYTQLSSMDEQLYAECMSDNAYTKQPNDYTQNIGNGSFSTADRYVAAIWDGRYSAIRSCNQLLDNIDKVSSLTPELKQRYIAEAKTIRAYHFYELYTRFGAIPYPEHVISIAESQTMKRTPRETVVNNIVTDLKEVIESNSLPASYDADNKGRITSGAAKAILAKVYLFEGQWDKVEQLTQDIINTKTYQLFPSYAGLFEVANEGNCEVILDVQYAPSTREQGTQYSFLPPTLGGYSQLSPLQELVDSYLMNNGKATDEADSGFNPAKPYENRDPSLAATVMYTGNSYKMADGSEVTINCEKGADKDGYGFSSDCSATGFYVKKYWDNQYRSSVGTSSLNTILIRYADILLMNAEAHAELGTLNETVWNNTIGAIRSRAGFTADGTAFPTASKDELINIVRQERRSELAMEGLRYKDIIRWKIAENVLNGWCHGLQTGDIVGADNGFIRVEQRKFDAKKHYLWPIPQKERDLNKNLDQNPNW